MPNGQDRPAFSRFPVPVGLSAPGQRPRSSGLLSCQTRRRQRTSDCSPPSEWGRTVPASSRFSAPSDRPCLTPAAVLLRDGNLETPGARCPSRSVFRKPGGRPAARGGPGAAAVDLTFDETVRASLAAIDFSQFDAVVAVRNLGGLTGEAF